MRFHTIMLLLPLLFVPLSVLAQAPADSTGAGIAGSRGKERERLAELEKAVRELEAKIEQSEREDEMRALLEEARQLSTREGEDEASLKERKFYSGLRHHAALNPNISLGGDYYYAYGSSKSAYNTERSELSWGTGRFFMREMELSFEGALDPYARGKAFIGLGDEGAGVEEGYIMLLNWPLNMNLKVGKYKMQFGTINRYHTHALPQFELPLVMTNFFSNETLRGTGIAANFLLPSITAHVNELDLEVVSGGADLSFTSEGRYNFVYVGHLKNYWDLSRSTFFELGLSGALGHNDPDETCETVIGGADLRLKWSPPERAKYRGIEWWTEAIYSHRQEMEGHVDSWGMFSLVQCRLGARWVCSLRLDYSQQPADNSLEEYGGAVSVEFWQSEFVFMRLQYSHIDRNFDEDDRRFYVQTVWAMGPHKHEAY
jgi:hypothetical protein